ncbi:MAG: pyridoxal phosphate-dependent aminotransferase [Holophagaceae bacterium]|nr:pyridoxal phosphate-dependent aminotransferase [Holophagaceae bacterium]
MSKIPFSDLTISNPTECGITIPEGEIITALSSGGISIYRPETKGSLVARRAISMMLGGVLCPDNIQLTASTSEAYSYLFKLLCNPGDNIIVPCPSYPLFEWLARLEGVISKAIPMMFFGGWKLDIEAIESACDANTRAIVVVNPNNPTGQFISESDWNDLMEVANKKHLSIIVDEVFASYPIEYQGDALHTVINGSMPSCPVFVLSGLSKLVASPQLKLAWIAMLGPAITAAEHLAFIADQYLSVSSPVASAVPALLEMAPTIQHKVISRVRDNLSILNNLLLEHPHLSRCPVYGGWCVLIRRPDIEPDEECATRLLSEYHLLIYPGHFFDINKNGFLVASLLLEPNKFFVAIEKLMRGLELNPAG